MLTVKVTVHFAAFVLLARGLRSQNISISSTFLYVILRPLLNDLDSTTKNLMSWVEGRYRSNSKDICTISSQNFLLPFSNGQLHERSEKLFSKRM